MLEWAVIADDLTGAADTGVQFLPVCAPVFLVDHRRLDAVALRAAAPAALAVFTNSRALPAGDARRAAAAAGRAIRRLGPARVYKKIDSALRGNIGTELEGVMEALELPLSFIAPAFPDQGRTTVGGIHCIHGVPVAEGEMGRDPVTPVTDSSLPRWISGQAAWPVGHVPLGTIEQGAAAVAREVERLQARRGAPRLLRRDGPRAPRARRPPGAGAVPRRAALRLCRPCPALGRLPEARPRVRNARRAAGRRTRRRRPALRLRVGVEEPARAGRAPGRSLRAGPRSASPRRARRSRALAGGGGGGRGGDDRRAATWCCRCPRSTRTRRGSTPTRWCPGWRSSWRAVVRRARTAGMFLSGGDTALAVMERLEVAAVRLERELASGLGCGVICGGPLTGGRCSPRRARSAGRRRWSSSTAGCGRGGSRPPRRALSNRTRTSRVLKFEIRSTKLETISKP